jgi:hypothetical protein
MVCSVQESYLAEDRIPRPYKKTTLHNINKFTSLLMSYGWLREDEANNSTCLGKWAIGTQFLFIGLLSEEAARAWFRPQAMEDLLFTMNLSVDEIPYLESHFLLEQNRPHRSAQLRKPLRQEHKLRSVIE